MRLCNITGVFISQHQRTQCTHTCTYSGTRIRSLAILVCLSMSPLGPQNLEVHTFSITNFCCLPICRHTCMYFDALEMQVRKVWNRNWLKLFMYIGIQWNLSNLGTLGQKEVSRLVRCPGWIVWHLGQQQCAVYWGVLISDCWVELQGYLIP